MERRSLIAAAMAASVVGPALAQTSEVSGRDRIASIGAVPLDDDPSIHAAPAVKALLGRVGPDGDLARNWLRFLQGITGREGLTVDDVVTPDVRCIDLELAGRSGDINALRAFRGGMNGALEGGFTLLEEMSVEPFRQVVEVTIHGGGRHVGEILGIPATGRQLAYDVRTLNHFKGGKMALRWDRTNLLAKVRALAAG